MKLLNSFNKLDAIITKYIKFISRKGFPIKIILAKKFKTLNLLIKRLIL